MASGAPLAYWAVKERGREECESAETTRPATQELIRIRQTEDAVVQAVQSGTEAKAVVGGEHSEKTTWKATEAAGGRWKKAMKWMVTEWMVAARRCGDGMH